MMISEHEEIQRFSWLASDAWDNQITRADIQNQLQAVLLLRLPFSLTLEQGWEDDLDMYSDCQVIVLRVLATQPE